MISDYVFPKPATATGYALHRISAGIAQGATVLFRDCGDSILMRSEAKLGDTAIQLAEPKVGDIRVFQLRASVSQKTRGKRSYYPVTDWRSRHAWLQRQGERHGFALLTVNCNAVFAKVEKTGKTFTVDQTDFTGALKVTDAGKFASALRTGIGSTARAFGFGLLLI